MTTKDTVTVHKAPPTEVQWEGDRFDAMPEIATVVERPVGRVCITGMGVYPNGQWKALGIVTPATGE